MDILYALSNIEPELKKELALIIKRQMPYSPPAFQARGSKILKKLYKEIGDNNINF